MQTGYWPLFRYNPDREAAGQNPFSLDSKPPTLGLEQYVYNEARFRMVQQDDPERAATMLLAAQHDIDRRWAIYERLAAQHETAPIPV